VRRIADRAVGRILTAPFRWRHWYALARIVTTFDRPAAASARYITNRGRYPWQPTLRTPLGPVSVTLADRHDLLTVNEVFCRRDYGSAARSTVVDIGANIGLATLFFLTRDPEARVWAFEPDPANVARLRETLTGFESRYSLSALAVTQDDVASVRFVPAGRYGRVASAGDAGLEVPAISIAQALRQVAQEAGAIDLVKIDTEGTERELAAAIPSDVEVREIRYEDGEGRVATVRRTPIPSAAPR
jgi:FkbM family methyltransferase